jgi:hypothetical protein
MKRRKTNGLKPPRVNIPEARFDYNRARLDVRILEPYGGMIVAWSSDGLKIVDADKDLGVLIDRLRAKGEATERFVYERIE